MKSIRNKVIVLNLVAVSISIIIAATIGAISLATYGHNNAREQLSLHCDNAKSSLNYYFKSVEQSVNIVSDLVDANLDALSEEEYTTNLSSHIDHVSELFYEAALNTSGAYTYYYRLDPEITAKTGEVGFWFTNLDGKGFVEHEVTDISDDKNECIWFYTPKETGKPIWLDPYLTDNLDVYVVSYNVPVYRNSSFVGVVGIEINYHTLGDQVNNIKPLGTGYAFIVENEHGTIIYHPELDILKIPVEERPSVPEGFLEGFKKGEHHVIYNFQGMTKHAYWMVLTNGMAVAVTVPELSINASWYNVLARIGIVAVGLLLVFAVITILFSRRITEPLKELTNAARDIENGNYNVELTYKGQDEIGTLTNAFNSLVKSLDEYIDDLNSIAYADALTSVKNKSAFNKKMEELEARIENPTEEVEFALAMFDCDNLKNINDDYGHDKGDIYLRNSCHLVCRIFKNSPVYRLGGDEFVAILENSDYRRRDQLVAHFKKRVDEIYAFAKEPWEKIRVSVGLASYDKEIDKSANDVLVHADHMMYTNKRDRKRYQGNKK